MTAATQPALTHRPELDGIRGIAIAAVVLAHALHPSFLFPGGGVIGVQVFFVLSGFLITSILVAERAGTGRVDLRRFYERRVRRLVPALVAFLLVMTAWSIATQHARYIQLAVSATYLANIARVAGLDLAELNHTWSLAVEEQFYIVWPLLLMAGLGVRRAAPWVAVAAAALLVWRMVLAATGAEWGRTYYATDTNAAALLAGAAIAIYGVPVTRHGRLIGLVSIAVIVGLCLTMTGRTAEGQRLLIGPGYLAATLASLGLVVAAMNAGSRWLAWRPLVFLGLISYALYLWHTSLNWMLEVDYGWELAARLLLIPASIAIAWASTTFLEARFRRRRSAGAVPDPEAPHARGVLDGPRAG